MILYTVCDWLSGLSCERDLDVRSPLYKGLFASLSRNFISCSCALNFRTGNLCAAAYLKLPDSKSSKKRKKFEHKWSFFCKLIHLYKAGIETRNDDHRCLCDGWKETDIP